MTGFNHVLTGIAIAITVRHPVAAPILAFISHFVLDSIPHFGDEEFQPWSKKLRRLLVVDAILCTTFLAVSIWLFPSLWWLLALCAFMATLPDWLWILHFGFGVKNWFFTFHKKIQWRERPWGVYVEIPFMIGMCLLIGCIAFRLN
ncbi:MAG TPA: hypothetical protein VH144_01300 [Candidatus Saccharimonadales bacterium]|jgi:putative flippase GtrA|nr:hypothetical protein [Candidatus Saccharimonadales bacterium]